MRVCAELPQTDANCSPWASPSSASTVMPRADPSAACSLLVLLKSFFQRHTHNTPGADEGSLCASICVRAVGDNPCDRRLLRGLHGGQAVQKPFPTLHTPRDTHEPGWPKAFLGAGGCAQPHSCYPCSTAASAFETSQGLGPALLDLEQVQQTALNIMFTDGLRLCISVAFHWPWKKKYQPVSQSNGWTTRWIILLSYCSCTLPWICSCGQQPWPVFLGQGRKHQELGWREQTSHIPSCVTTWCMATWSALTSLTFWHSHHPQETLLHVSSSTPFKWGHKHRVIES